MIAARLTVGDAAYEIVEVELGMGRPGKGYQVRRVAPGPAHIFGNPKATFADAMIWLAEVVTDVVLLRAPMVKDRFPVAAGAIDYHAGDERSVGAGPEEG